MSSGLSLKQKAMRTSILTVVNLRASRLAGVPPFALGLRWLSSHLVPWAARAGFRGGIHSVNGIALEIPRPPDWGGGGSSTWHWAPTNTMN